MRRAEGPVGPLGSAAGPLEPLKRGSARYFDEAPPLPPCARRLRLWGVPEVPGGLLARHGASGPWRGAKR